MMRSQTSTQLSTTISRINLGKSFRTNNNPSNKSIYNNKRLQSSKILGSGKIKHSSIETPFTPVTPTPPLSPLNLPSQKNLFKKALSSKTLIPFMFQSRNTNPNNSHTCYSSTIIQTGTLSQDNVNPQSFLLTPRSISPNTPNNAQPHHRSSIKSSKSSKNKINFKERSQIRKTAATYANKASTYGTLFEIDPEKLLHNKTTSKQSSSNIPNSNNSILSYYNDVSFPLSSSNNKLTSLMKKSLYDILPKELKYNYDTSSQFRDLLSNTQHALHQQKKDTRKCLHSTTILIKKYKQHNKVLEQLLNKRNINSSHNKQMKHFLKLQSIKWLWQHKSLLIEKLFLYYQNYKWFFDKNEYLDMKKFKEFLIITNLGKDDVFVEHLFLTFEQQSHESYKEVIYFKECLFYLILTADCSYARKIQLMLSIVESTTTKKIPVDKLLNLLLLTISNVKEWNYINILFKNNGIDTRNNNCNVDRQVVVKILIGSDVVKAIFNLYYERYKQINVKFSEQLIHKFNFAAPNTMNVLYQGNDIKVCNNLEIAKLDKLLDIRQDKINAVEQFQNKYNKHKHINNEEYNSDDDNEEDEIDNNNIQIEIVK